ncbi:hypothetical protein [Streptomyces sp. NPDC096311]|uniref:hypothetical protein n=1 Tax=Streptomyces sp. NPDC096311 TaxID=3366083 RepID=UPI0038307339
MRNILVRPSVIARGGQLSITVDGEACRRPGSTVSSRVFRTTLLRRVGGDTSIATVTVDRDARPGSYDVTARCDDRRLTRAAAFTVIGGVSGGLGGSVGGAAPADVAIGSGLLTAGVVGGGVFWLRRRSERRI